MKELRSRYGNIFDEEIEYYQKEWHDYYDTIIPLVPADSYVLDVGCGKGGLLEYLIRNLGRET